MTHTAIAEGKIHLKESTITMILEKKISKGDPLYAAELAAMHGAKQASSMIVHCNPILLESIVFDHEVTANCISVTVIVRAGNVCEMESLIGVNMALLTIWEMVRYIDKGRISDIKVIGNG